MNESAFHPEEKARSLIDRRLVACGGLIQSKDEMKISTLAQSHALGNRLAVD